MPAYHWTPYQTTSLGNDHTAPLKAGIGLRHPHHDALESTKPDVGFLEVHAENVMNDGAASKTLDRLAQNYPISIHGVGLSVAGPDPLNTDHLDRWVGLLDRYSPAQISEHLAWSVSETAYHNDLLPIPFTEEALDHVAARVNHIQDRLKRPILIENPSSYLEFTSSTITEWDFLAALVQRTGCGLLLDLNNIMVAHHNHGYDPITYLNALPLDHVGEIHLAGHSIMNVPLGAPAQTDGPTHPVHIDDHGSHVAEETWRLYEQALRLMGPTPTLIEWDSNIPDLNVLVAEAAKADTIVQRILHEQAA